MALYGIRLSPLSGTCHKKPVDDPPLARITSSKHIKGNGTITSAGRSLVSPGYHRAVVPAGPTDGLLRHPPHLLLRRTNELNHSQRLGNCHQRSTLWITRHQLNRLSLLQRSHDYFSLHMGCYSVQIYAKDKRDSGDVETAQLALERSIPLAEDRVIKTYKGLGIFQPCLCDWVIKGLGMSSRVCVTG